MLINLLNMRHMTKKSLKPRDIMKNQCKSGHSDVMGEPKKTTHNTNSSLIV